MSRFFRGGGSDSESSSSSDEELFSGSERSDDVPEDESELSGSASSESSDDEEERQKKGSAYFLKGADSEESEEEDERKRVVKSAKDKRVEEVEASIRIIENGEKINDWVAISSEFDRLSRIITKIPTTGSTYKSFLKTIIELEQTMLVAIKKEKDVKKKSNATNARALNTFKQRIRKFNRAYEDDIKRFRENPELFDEEVVESEEMNKSRKTARAGEDVDQQSQADGEEGFSTVGKGGKTLVYTTEGIFKHLRAIFEARGKKSTDKAENIRVLEKLLEVSITPYQKIRVMLALIASRFDYNLSSSSYMPAEQWEKAADEFRQLLQLLDEHTEYQVIEDAEDIDDDNIPVLKPGEVLNIRGSLVSYVDRLDDELTRALQHIDPHTPEYLERLKNESQLYGLIYRCQKHHEKYEMSEMMPRIIMRRLEHIYYKSRNLINIMEQSVDPDIPKDSFAPEHADRLVKNLCIYIFKHGQPLFRTRAILFHIYYLALHGQFFNARDMLLMSHLQETISGADVGTQILFNRAMMQLGLCAFRLGMIPEALSALADIHSTSRVKELLAQGIQSRYGQISPEQEKAERQRQLPFHMFINLELLEAAFLTCSMLMEIPAMAAAGSSPDAKRRVISKSFRRHLEFAERQPFVGPPENTREHIMQASKALMAGDWERCAELILKIDIWNLLPESDSVREMLRTKIQMEGLRTYLFGFAGYYDSISIASLSKLFSLPEQKVTAIVSKLITQDEIPAALDQVKVAIVLQKINHTRLQSLALSLAEKASKHWDRSR